MKLNRPFAQLNVGTNDSTQAAVSGFKFADATSTSLVVKGIANKLDLFTGEVSGDAEAKIAFASNSLPGVKETFPPEG